MLKASLLDFLQIASSVVALAFCWMDMCFDLPVWYSPESRSAKTDAYVYYTTILKGIRLASLL